MRRLLLLVPALLLALGTATACGDGGSGDGVATAGGTAEADGTQLTDEEQGRAFAQCMRENGIEMPDPDPDGGGGLAGLQGLDIDRDQLMEAMDACRDLLPGGPGGQLELDPETLDQLGEFAQCMRENGVDLPDPDPNGGLGLGLGEAGIDPGDPQFEAALEVCQDLLTGLREGGR